jgi:hypothetical protein
VKDRANEIYKKVEDLKSIRGRSQDAILAACLYIACRQEDKPRTFKGCGYESGHLIGHGRVGLWLLVPIVVPICQWIHFVWFRVKLCLLSIPKSKLFSFPP